MNQILQDQTQLLDHRIAYCAGYFDGEGCIWVGTMKGSQYYLRINVMTADYETLLLFAKLFGGHVMPVRASRPRKKIFHWSKDSTEAVETLAILLPYMTAKRREAQLVIDFGWEPTLRGTRLSEAQIAKRKALREALKAEKMKGLKSA